MSESNAQDDEARSAGYSGLLELPFETTVEDYEWLVAQERKNINEMRREQDALRHEIESRLPLTPWGFIWALIRALWKRKQLQRQTSYRSRRPRNRRSRRKRAS